jgi:hypothetical protein
VGASTADIDAAQDLRAEEPSEGRRGFLRSAAVAAAAGGGLLATRAEPAHAQGEDTSGTTDVHGISDTSKLALLEAPNAAADGLRLEPNGTRGSLRLGIDGSDGRASFAGTTTPEPYEAIRLSHPVDPRGNAPNHLPGAPVDLHIVPYNAGMAIEFKGIIEAWVEDFSIHNNNRGGGTSADGARFWVGNNRDSGALFMTAHTEPDEDPRRRWVRLASRSFNGDEGNGPMQFVVVDPLDHFSFGHGDTGGGNPGQIGNPTETLRIESDGSLKADGSISIKGRIASGTDEPLARLHLAEKGGVSARLEDSSAAGGAAALEQNGRTLALHLFDAAGGYSSTPLRIEGGTGNLHPGGDVQFDTRGRGIIVTSPNGRKRRRIGINNKGKLSVTRV